MEANFLVVGVGGQGGASQSPAEARLVVLRRVPEERRQRQVAAGATVLASYNYAEPTSKMELCLSEPDATRLIADAMAASLTKFPKLRMFNVNLDEIAYFRMCSLCKASDRSNDQLMCDWITAMDEAIKQAAWLCGRNGEILCDWFGGAQRTPSANPGLGQHEAAAPGGSRGPLRCASSPSAGRPGGQGAFLDGLEHLLQQAGLVDRPGDHHPVVDGSGGNRANAVLLGQAREFADLNHRRPEVGASHGQPVGGTGHCGAVGARRRHEDGEGCAALEPAKLLADRLG